MQFAEHLSDRQVTDAVCSRIDWKYALGLELTDPGFDHTLYVPSVTACWNGARLWGLLKAREAQRADSTSVLAAVRGLNRLALVKKRCDTLWRTWLWLPQFVLATT
jgi:hypothetical protein